MSKVSFVTSNAGSNAHRQVQVRGLSDTKLGPPARASFPGTLCSRFDLYIGQGIKNRLPGREAKRPGIWGLLFFQRGGSAGRPSTWVVADLRTVLIYGLSIVDRYPPLGVQYPQWSLDQSSFIDTSRAEHELRVPADL